MTTTAAASAPPVFAAYRPLPDAHDELVQANGAARPHAEALLRSLALSSSDELARLHSLAERVLVDTGVTFSVYSDERGTEKILPFCLIPRIIAGREWRRLEAGLVQRLAALELFLDDIYGPQRILREGAVPGDMILAAKGYDARLRGVRPAGEVRVHIAGVDLIRDPDGTFRVLEDNLRTPSGVSYVLENRQVVKRVLPRTLERSGVRSVWVARIASTSMLWKRAAISPGSIFCRRSSSSARRAGSQSITSGFVSRSVNG